MCMHACVCVIETDLNMHVRYVIQYMLVYIICMRYIILYA